MLPGPTRMAERLTSIQVPPRGDDEPPASAEQLQTIRAMVTGMSLSGFRFDYRKLGADQADAVIDALSRLRGASGPAAPPSGGGCVTSLARGVVTLIVAAVVLAGVAGGGYLIYQKVNEKPEGGGNQQAVQDPSDAQPQQPSGRTPGHSQQGQTDPPGRESKFFDGLRVVDDPNDPLAQRDLPPDTQTPGVTPPDRETPTPPAPRVDPRVAAQLDDLEKLLAQLSQFTRKDYDQSIRQQSADLMQKNLSRLSEAMQAVSAADPALAERIRAAVAGYGAASLDGTKLRGEIDAIRVGLDKVREGL